MVTVKCLHELIEAQARRTPAAAALAFEGRRLTYAELDARANRLAGHLRERGAAPEARVALLVERSLELMVGILGVLKAGAAYVPIDTAYPPERIAYMLADSGASLVLTQGELMPQLPLQRPPVVRLDQFDWHGTCEADWHGTCEAPQRAAGADSLAYVIYTSGSTGRPKGVAVEHRNIVNYVLGVAERLGLEPGMNHATVSTIAADLGNTVIFPALVTGGCLHVVSQQRAESQALLSEYFARERIDVLKIVPSHLAALQASQQHRPVMPARRLVLGGEATRLDSIARLRTLVPECEIFNHYGPTETTVGVLTYRVGAELPSTTSRTLPLGRPLPGSSVYLLDDQGRPVPQGEKGELWVGGGGVARGYLGRPELSAERFVADPFCAEPGARMYRTGDLGRALSDGSIEFCGRVDHQVKLHGYRVELGEIEGTLREHATVQDAAVLVHEDAAGDKQLVAFVSAAASQPAPFAEALEPATLREDLKARLPLYMVPTTFFIMETLPLTANGKIDRQALAALAVGARQTRRDFVAPSTAAEKALAEIWGELLKMDRVGIHDDVFDLGAHSLMAMKALTRIRDVFQVDLALRNLFEHPTIAGLGRMIEGLALVRGAVRSAGEREEVVL